MPPVSEQCTNACGARIDLVPGMALLDASKFISTWRKDHRHYDGVMPQTPPFGFPIPQRVNAVSTEVALGDEEPDFDGE